MESECSCRWQLHCNQKANPAALAELEAERQLRAELAQSAYAHEWLDPNSPDTYICKEYFTRTEALPRQMHSMT